MIKWKTIEEGDRYLRIISQNMSSKVVVQRKENAEHSNMKWYIITN